MSNSTNVILFWILGWFILSLGNYIYRVYIDRDKSVNKKVHAWRAFCIGPWSWAGIFCVVVFLICDGLISLDEWIENKLSK